MFFTYIFAVKVKWGKETFTDVEANTAEPPLVFKAQLFALTGVQPDRQKVMVKGASLKDDDWNNIKLKNASIHLKISQFEMLLHFLNVFHPVMSAYYS